MTNKPTLKIDRARRTHTIKIRASAQEHACLLEQAGDAALAVFIRQKLLTENVVTTKRQARKTPTRLDRDAGCAILAREIAKIGNNLNQLARAANISIKDNKSINSLILGMRLYAIWEQLYVLQNLQTGQGQSNGYRLSDESKGRQWSDQESTCNINER